MRIAFEHNLCSLLERSDRSIKFAVEWRIAVRYEIHTYNECHNKQNQWLATFFCSLSFQKHFVVYFFICSKSLSQKSLFSCFIHCYRKLLFICFWFIFNNCYYLLFIVLYHLIAFLDCLKHFEWNINRICCHFNIYI